MKGYCCLELKLVKFQRKTVNPWSSYSQDELIFVILFTSSLVSVVILSSENSSYSSFSVSAQKDPIFLLQHLSVSVWSSHCLE